MYVNCTISLIEVHFFPRPSEISPKMRLSLGRLLGSFPSVSHYLLGKVSVVGVASASSDGLLLELVASDDDVSSFSGVASGAISLSASATIKIMNGIRQLLLEKEGPMHTS